MRLRKMFVRSGLVASTMRVCGRTSVRHNVRYSLIWLPQTIFVQALQPDWNGDYTFSIFRFTLEQLFNLSWSDAISCESFFNLPSVSGRER